MQIVKTLALGLLASLFWNCNDATQPEANKAPDARVPATINALVKTAAINAGMIPVDPIPEPDPLPFSTDALAALKNAGLCQGFIDLFEELTTTQQNFEAGTFTPRLQETINCFSKKIELDSTLIKTDFMSVVDECFCKGTGTLFGSFTFQLAKYAPPEVGGRYAEPGISSTPYRAPESIAKPYAAPTNPAGKGYSAPEL